MVLKKIRTRTRPSGTPVPPRLAVPRLFCLLRWDLPVYVRRPKELKDFLAALVREQLGHLPFALPALRYLLHSSPHCLLLSSPRGAVLEKVFQVCLAQWHHVWSWVFDAEVGGITRIGDQWLEGSGRRVLGSGVSLL